MVKKFIEDMTLVEALDNLSSMADLDIENVKKEKEAARGGGKVTASPYRWLDFGDDAHTVENIKQTFRALHVYLKEIYHKDKERLFDPEVQQGVRAMMLLAKEAAINIDKYTDILRHGVAAKKAEDLSEYKNLTEFYEKKLLKKFQKVADLKEFWKEEWGESEEDFLDIEKRGIKDIEAVKRDKQYELLYLKKEDGKRFFNDHLLRHIKLVVDFDRIILLDTYDDPFTKVQKVLDKDAIESARQIKQEVLGHTGKFFKRHDHFRSSEFYNYLSFAIYSLCLATSHHNLIEEGGKKSCSQYYYDFLKHLDAAFTATDYLKFEKEEFEELDVFIREMMMLAFQLCAQFFVKVGSKDRSIGLINQLADKELPGGKKRVPRNSQHLWSSFFDENEHIASVIRRYPNGPVFKTLDNFIDKERHKSFDPIYQENYPRSLYHVFNEGMRISCIRLPSPTRQTNIAKASCTPIFKGFVNAVRHLGNSQKFLYFNMQDRTSWNEHARCHAIESLPKDALYSDFLDVCTFAKDTTFYHQTEDYTNTKSAADFINLLKQQVLSGEECGFFYPKSISIKYLEAFVNQCVDLIHKSIFGGRNALSRKNRMDFIEIFYNFFYLKIIELIQPTHLSFSCKDSVDVGPATYSGFFAFIKLLSEDHDWSCEEEDFFMWMMQNPAITYRERPIHLDRFNRAVSALAVLNAELDTDRAKMLKAFEKLYDTPILKNLGVQEDTA